LWYSGKMETSNQPEVVSKETGTVHHVLAHSYFFYFISFLFGVFLDFFYPVRIFSNPAMIPIGIVFLIFASFLILWAQKTSQDLRKIEKKSKEAFCRGPYCYTRSPTHWGLFLLILGFSIITNALFVTVFTIIAFLVSKFVFLKKEESVLVEKYGTPYVEYKKLVKF